MSWRTEPLRRVAPPKPAQVQFSSQEQAWHLGLEHIESQSGRILERRWAPASEAGTSTFVFDEGNVLYSKLRPYLNKVVRPRDPGIATTELVPLRPRPGVMDADYLTYFLRSPGFVTFASACVAGVKMPRVMMDKLWEYRVPVPPPSEQRRIVELLEQADAIRHKRTEADAKADRILPALFLSMFGEPKKNTKGWTYRPLGDLAVHLTSGSRAWSKRTGHGDALFLRTQDINDGEIAGGLLAVDAPRGAEAERTRLQARDVVVTITGSVGKAAVFRMAAAPVYVSQHVALVRTREDVLDADYLAAYANLPLGEVPILARFQYGQTKPGLGFAELKTARIPVPPLDRQLRFREHTGSFFSGRRRREESAAKLALLWNAMLQRAFTGSLTASWRRAHVTELLQEIECQARYLGAGGAEESR